MELPKKDGVPPSSKETKTSFRILKYWTMVSEEIKTPATNNALNNFFQLFSSVKRAKKQAKAKKNSKFKTPPALCGEPKTLNTGSCENRVDKIRVIKKAESISKGK
ncbi:MAG: hypothetical protein US35_C0037G0003 [Parcubacteria group bacterium GW2011_GWA2_37_10]|nr:MAG: hypothetical protein US35_C0037G0003 [Parcubacteria group bacterium GW2011_GWA2_37_10]